MESMSSVQWVSIIASLGWLVLVLGAYRSYQVDTSKTIRMALTWAAIFTGLAVFFTLLT
ncbi:hypothetical protein [Aurantiacibacter sp. D1-12]|uniref:hypothetical protein n=1 Tax=Aurantiacibacter sp. D1-12 TaxID=2993658 RepID=UPI00237D2CD0|nr:hypothetical protein [Aurantiacibacter sp. D1-12]MDE1466754.1 hypothetical protein [Aurantiacibacter sp. D1-12]